MSERVDLDAQWVEIPLEEWHRETEAWADAQYRQAVKWASWGLRFQGFLAGAAVASLIWYFAA